MRPKIAVLLAIAGCAGPPVDPDATPTADVPFAHPDATPDVAADPRLFVVVSDAIRGEGLPCKLTVNGVDGTATPAWRSRDPQDLARDPLGEQIGEWVDRENWALGIGRWVLMARGRAAVRLPPGRYRLTVTRGGEYAALDLGTVTMGETSGAVVRGDLRRVVDTAGAIAGEFHVHSEPSGDSDVPLDQRVLSLAVEGVEVFASTDHDAVGDFAPAIAALGLERFVHWIRGDEITAEGRGHFNAYPLAAGTDVSPERLHDGLTVAQILARARAIAPVVQLNHPLWRQHPIGYWSVAGFDPATGRSGMELVSEFDAVEVWNSHTLDEDDASYVGPDGVIDAWMATLQLGHGATAMGNTDTHRLSHSPPGWPRTYVRVADDDPAHVTDMMVTTGILAGDAVLTSGPYVRASVQGVAPGGLVRAAGRTVTVRVELQAPAWTPVDRVAIVANRRVVAERDVTATLQDGVRRQRWDVPVELSRDAWIVVRTHAAAPVADLAGVHARPLPSLALVNPVYVDVDGNGVWNPPGIDGGP